MDNEVINNYQKDNMPKNIRVLLIPRFMSDEELSNNNIHPSATVEAKYGEKIIKGSQITLTHHIKESRNNPEPCNTQDVPILHDNSTIVINHFDLDTLGGVATLMGRKKENSEFWKVAEFIDLNGSHNLFKVEEQIEQKYIAYQAYQASHRNPNYTEITDVTNTVLEHLEVIDKIIDGDKSLIQDGIKWKEENEAKIEECLVFENDNVRVFDSSEGIFCSASYYSKKQDKIIPSTVTMNEKSKSITVAMEDRGKKISAKELVQKLWGYEAGGYTGIAGSPRGQKMTKKDLQQMVELVNERYNNINKSNEPIYFEPDEILIDKDTKEI